MRISDINTEELFLKLLFDVSEQWQKVIDKYICCCHVNTNDTPGITTSENARVFVVKFVWISDYKFQKTFLTTFYFIRKQMCLIIHSTLTQYTTIIV